MSKQRRAARRSAAGYRTSLPWRIVTAGAEKVDRRIGWDRLPVIPGLLTLLGLRVKLRQENLHDTGQLPSVDLPDPAPPSESHRVNRTADGSHNDLDEPRMGMAGTRFGRNIPLDRIAPATPEDVLSAPSPREVSRALLTRDELTPAESVNSLVAAWLQFMVRDWFSHGTSPTERPWEVPLMDDDPWPEHPMRIMRTPDDPTRDPQAPAGTPDTRVNVSSHWWDASQIYGTNETEQRQMRSGRTGKLHLWDDEQSPFPSDPARDPSHIPGFWLGLAMMHDLFAREHNAICDHLHGAYPSWNDEELFQRARLVNAALLAKIHTVEWTPAVISHPTTVKALRANWWGIAGERVHNLFGRISDSEVVSGIPGGERDHYGVPYSLTEEFVAVYRMHPLIRDEWHLRSADDDTSLRHCTLRDISGPGALKVLETTEMADLLYSFGTLHPGLVTLHNFPKFLQEFERPDGQLQDLAATDILRSRELGVPRYNEFRRLLRLKPAANFLELAENRAVAEQIEQLYDGDIEKVDLMVGLYAEKLPAGFAFSDTAFRIFILMASRRLNSDRFFTEYYTPEVYSKAGMAWIDDNSMITVLLRHHPELRTALAGLTNAFVPWHTAGRTVT
ncbi:heme peroxidase [Streptomyces viridochromogenes]|uniref:Heme peroxidase n=1 Tax=Streptomyces viridochromogenes TaxID=1938 RepID=A0A0J7ZKT6_STRVR|nr:peroxidase family protein [Streptomyces viridochromogenes]KMS76504.1 heme peroxidase [Streptomyces viridochromogenes]KOG23281.1 heme peroxidase [Streptomyces viridochromogenes]KOG27114.1 heme peroxidase [Streptomyces viridochromogenes]